MKTLCKAINLRTRKHTLPLPAPCNRLTGSCKCPHGCGRGRSFPQSTSVKLKVQFLIQRPISWFFWFIWSGFGILFDLLCIVSMQMFFGEILFRLSISADSTASAAQHKAQGLPWCKHQVFIPSDENPPEPSSWTVPAFSTFPQITISPSSSSSIDGLAPICPCWPRTGPSTPHMTSPVLSRGKDQPPWAAGTTLPLADQCTPSNWPPAGLGLLITALWTLSFSQ